MDMQIPPWHSVLQIIKSSDWCQDKGKVLNYGPQGHRGDHTHASFSLLQPRVLTMLMPTTGSPAAGLAHISPNSTRSDSLPPLHFLAWPVSLPCRLSAASPLPRGTPSCPPSQVSCPSPSLVLSQIEFCIFMIVEWFFSAPWTLGCMKTRTVSSLLSTVPPGPSMVPDKKEGLSTILVEWLGYQPLQWAMCTGKYQKR